MIIRKKVAGRLKKTIEDFRFRRIRKMGISIISNNCAGGLLYNHFGCRFQSPTINLQISPEDYLRFCENLDYYCSLDISEESPLNAIELFRTLGGTTIGFPVGRLGDLTLFFQHFDSFQQAVCKWNERKKRIDYDRLFFVFVDTNCTKEMVRRFLNLPFRNKLFLTSNTGFLLDPICVLFHSEPWFESDWLHVFNYKKWFEGK